MTDPVPPFTRHPIVSVLMTGGTIAQGPTIDEADVKRGSLPTDMHGNLAIDASGHVAVGKPIPSVRKGEPDR